MLSFASDVAIERNGDLEVTETIRVEAEGDAIRHGINRDFPTRYRGEHGARMRVGFTVESVERDGKAEPYELQPLENGVRIHIGAAETLLEPGPHDYVIRYRTSRQIGFFAEMDELYWNVTGEGWVFPIDSAEARITLPEPVPFQGTTAYTGPPGSREHAAMVLEDSSHPGTITFRTSRPLAAGSGLTVAVGWQKGIVDPPSFSRRARWWVSDNRAALAAFFGAALALGYFALAWLRVGRDPPRGPLVPLFSPPDGLSAAGARYVNAMGFDDRAFTAALLDCGVHGHLALADNGPTLVVTEKTAATPLPPPEAAMTAVLFRQGPSLPLEQSRHAQLSEAKSALSRGLAQAYSGTIFHWNGGWLAIGIVLTLLAYAVTIAGLITGDGERGVVAAVGLVFASVAGIVAGAAVTAGPSGRSLLSRLAAIIVMGLVALAFGAVGLLLFVTSVDAPLGLLPLVLPLVVLPIAVSAFGWMRSPTIEGQRLRDSVAGFRHYLGIAEEHRLDVLHPPEKTPELFERYLPYAVALDVENAWAAKFAGILAAAGASAAVSTWYLTTSHRDPGSLVDRLGSSLSQTVAAASTAPGSSSGFSSSGGAGGGGGGGGGSGW